MNFSTRTNWNLDQSDFTAALHARRAQGLPLLDLTVSNPTTCGFAYHAPSLLTPLASPEALNYEPDPLGMRSAREAVSLYYRDHGANVPIDRICLTTSTSEAYSFLFRLLCNAGDEVLIARPSYPLFDYIAQLDDVTLREYPLLYDPNAGAASTHGWSVDLHALEAAITHRTRAIVVVHPNNPTGSFASNAERRALQLICARNNLALIVDEVFLDYPIQEAQSSFSVDEPRCLTFILSGVSKVCGLPQMKVSWLVACGSPALVRSAMERLEVIADTFLSMNAPVQCALQTWLSDRNRIQQQIHERMIANLASVDDHVQGTSLQRLALQAGWSCVLRVPRTVDGKDFVSAALDRGVIVQPGYFYGLGEGRVILSLLTPQKIWKAGLDLLPLE